MDKYELQLNPQFQPKPRKSGLKIGAGIAGVVLVAGLLVYSGGFESFLKLLGVGASGIYEVAITNNEQWLGFNHGEDWLIGDPALEGVGVFSSFTGTPKDPNQDTGRGMVLPIFSSPTDPARESYLTHEYISPVVDMEFGSVHLSAIEVIDAVPSGASISYGYQVADSPATLAQNPNFLPLELNVVNSAEGDVRVRTEIIERPVGRYARIKFVFHNADPMHRPAVYAASFQYKDGGDVVELEDIEGTLSSRNISVLYDAINAPVGADIDILAADGANSRVYSAKGVDLAERLSYSFAADLTPGAYALVVSSPTIETVITPFLVGSGPDVTISLPPFELSLGQDLGADLNGDGVVNTLDLQLLLQRFSS